MLRVGHLRGQAVARGLERVELGAPGQLAFEFAIDVGADGVQAVQPRFELLDERHAGRDARELGVELGHGLVEARRFLRALFDQ